MNAMKISYDQATDSLYIHLSDRASVESDEVQDGVVLDVDADGALLGVDLQHASQHVDMQDLFVAGLPLMRLHTVLATGARTTASSTTPGPTPAARTSAKA